MCWCAVNFSFLIQDQMLIESLQNRVFYLEEELNELHQIAESTQNVGL